MDIELLPANLKTLTELSIIPISFEVNTIFRVELVKGGLGGVRLREVPVSHPYVKDYDARDGEGPTRWLSRFDTNNWVVLLARQKGTAIGGGALVINSPGIDMLRRRQDLAVLWDLRVRPEFRGQGTELFRRAAQLAGKRDALSSRWKLRT